MSVNLIEQAEEEYTEQQGEVYSFMDFLEEVEDNPSSVVNSVQYLVDAIEHFGTREVIEYGEKVERYRFFDDPTNNGEHAVLGNTEELNDFVDSLKRKASPDGENDKVIWFTGPTASGKSELKRCLLNGLQAYAHTPEGKRYTLEWSLGSLTGDGLTYGNARSEEQDWYRSPVHVNPLLVLPEETREEFTNGLAGEVSIEGELDPFSRVAYRRLSKKYDSFEDIVSENHLRVVSYTPEMGEGFGVLQSEDGGDPKSKMVGSWMREAMEEYAERGRKDAQAFTYDGVLSQGNSSVSLIEDAQHHSKVFSKLMNVCEENVVKLDNKITMHLDTVIICISNPDFEAALTEYEDAEEQDPNKALRRRLEKYRMKYLTSVILETQLLIKHLTKDNVLWKEEDVGTLYDKAAQPIEKFETHFSPHAVEVAAYYNVISRLSGNNEWIDESEKVEYYDWGLERGDYSCDDLDEKDLVEHLDGINGLPVTYTEEVLSQLAQDEEEAVMPFDVIEAIINNMANAPVISTKDVRSVTEHKDDVKQFAYERMERDMLDSIVGDDDISRDEIDNYVDSLFSWEEGEEEDYDPYELREFEKSYFNTTSDEYKSEAEPKEGIVEFREDKILKPINSYIYEHKDEYKSGNFPIEESHAIKSLLEDESWERVEQLFPDFDYNMWSDPPEGTETEEVKERTIENMKEKGYTEVSAEKATARVLKYRR